MISEYHFPLKGMRAFWRSGCLSGVGRVRDQPGSEEGIKNDYTLNEKDTRANLKSWAKMRQIEPHKK